MGAGLLKSSRHPEFYLEGRIIYLRGEKKEYDLRKHWTPFEDMNIIKAFLEIELTLTKDNFKGKILAQDEKIRGKGNLVRTKNLTINSFEHPQSCYGTLYIRGTQQDRDDEYFLILNGNPIAFTKNLIECMEKWDNQDPPEVTKVKETIELLRQISKTPPDLLEFLEGELRRLK